MNKPQAINGPCTGEGQMELRVEVAELCGWVRQLFQQDFGYRWVKDGVWTNWSNREPSPIPDYCNDLNACHVFKQALTTLQQKAMFVHHLLCLLSYDRNIPFFDGEAATPEFMEMCLALASATAEQRCRAFVKTMEASPVPKAPESADVTRASIPKSSSSEGPNQ